MTRTRATAVTFEADRANGVEIVGPNGIGQVRAVREIIVCLSAIDSPKLLMLSGIGDEKQLQSLGMKVRQHLPGVGKNLTDHPLSTLVLLPKMAGWMRSEPSKSNLLEAGLFFSRQVPEPGFAADVQFHFGPYAPILVAARGTPTAMAIAMNPCRPRSRGSVRLRSSDPFDSPLIDPAYLGDADDMTLQIEAFREARRIAAAEPLASMIERELMPGASCSSDAELELYLRAASDCAWHPVGTCRMGVGSDAVVDPDLRVHGLRNLRVADASVMPRITSGNTNARTIMIADKASRCVM